jgi:hypothetical protein
MIFDDVDWVNIIGFSALEIKSPFFSRSIRQRFKTVVFDSYHFDLAKRSKDQKVEEFFGEKPPKEIQGVFDTLFPYISEKRSASKCAPDEIAFRRPLLNLLRLSVIPGAISRAEILALTQAGGLQAASEKLAELAKKYDPSQIISRIDDIGWYVRLDVEFWITLCRYFEGLPAATYEEAYQKREFVRGVVDALDSFLRRKVEASERRQILERLIAEGCLESAMHLLRTQFFRLGLFRWQARNPDLATYSKDVVTELAERLGDMFLDAISARGFEWIDDPNIIFFLNDMVKWDAGRDAFSGQLEANPRLVDRLVFWLAAGRYGFDIDTLKVFGQPDEVRDAIVRRAANGLDGLSELVRNAYAKTQETLERENRRTARDQAET